MLSDLEAMFTTNNTITTPQILTRQAFKTCHILLPDTSKPVSAITYNNQLYSYVKFYPTADAAERAFQRIIGHGNKAVLTQIPKGLVLWVLEPDAQLAV